MSNPLRDNIIGMNEDRKETCVGCGKRWYAKWFKDGFCNECQNDGTYYEYLRRKDINQLKGWAYGIFLIILFGIICSLIL